MESLLFSWSEGGGAGVLAGAGLDGNDDFVLRFFGEGGNGEKAKSECGEAVAHRSISSELAP